MDRYERIYGYGFLDDLHNLFPDLLYADRPFSSEFQYIRDRTRQLFPIRYAQGRLEYQMDINIFNSILVMIPATPLSTRWQSLLAYVQDVETIEHTQMTPVVVRPTIEQINEASSITPHTEIDASHVCTICQDHGSAEDTPEWRELDGCGHLYHKKCIDRWFETSVQCPICRMDIRD